VLGIEKLVHYSLIAGDKALAGYAYENAMAHFQRGLAAKAGQPVDEQTAELLYGLGRAELALWLQDEAAAHLGSAFDYYARVGNAQRCAAIASPAESSGFHFESLMAPIVERALQLVPAESVAAGRLSGQLSLYVGQVSGDYEAAKALFQRAVTIAQATGERRLELWATQFWIHVAVGWLNNRDAEEAVDRALDLLQSVDSARDEAGVRSRAVLRCIGHGEVREAAAQAEAALAAAERLRDRGVLCFVGCQVHMLTQYIGNWVEARALSERMLAMNPGYPEALARTLLLECQLGNSEQAESYWQRLLENAERMDYLWVVFGGWTWAAEAGRITGNRQ